MVLLNSTPISEINYGHILTADCWLSSSVGLLDIYPVKAYGKSLLS